MGQSSAKLSSNDVKDLKAVTYFDKHELQQWYRDFMSECPEGILRKEEFRAIYQQFFPAGDSTKFAGFVFDVFDSNKRGCISFREFILALSTTSRGSMDEKLDWAFCLYDVDGDGYIGKSEMMLIVDAIYQMVGTVLDLPVDENTPEKRVDKIFKQMDLNRDGRLSKDEFREGSKCDPWIVQALSMELPGLKNKNRNNRNNKRNI